MDFLREFGLVVILIFLGVFFLAERLLPLRRPCRSLLNRLVVNGCLSLLTLLTAFILVRPSAMATLIWTNDKGYGLLSVWMLPPWVEGIAGFLLLDLSFYYWHRLNHRIFILWRFHNIHHFDPDLDVTTGFRFHFMEVAISTIFRILQVFIIGISLPVFILYEFIFQICTYFHHSNLRLPRIFDQCLNMAVVTPRMHSIHHSNFRDETNSNYSIVFSIWDRIHRTFRTGIAQKDIVIGVPGYSSDEFNRLGNVLRAPFRFQRDYWKDQETR